MANHVKGIIVASILVYAWGFAYWGASPFPYQAWNETADDQAAGAALREHFPESGVYFLPANGNPPEQRAELYATGPVGFVILDRDGRPEFDPGIMVQGFLLNVVVITLLTLLLRSVVTAIPTYGQRFRAVLLVGLIAVVFVDLGRAVWWMIPWPWVLAQSFYDFTALALAGAVLAHFVRAED